jgi:hypothetical protein
MTKGESKVKTITLEIPGELGRDLVRKPNTEPRDHKVAKEATL